MSYRLVRSNGAQAPVDYAGHAYGDASMTDAQQVAASASPDQAGKTTAKVLIGLAPTVAMMAPPVSFAIAGGLAAAAGTIGLVVAIRNGKRKQKEIVALAEQMGIEDAAEVPAFTARAVKMDEAKLAKLGAKFKKNLDKAKGKKKQGKMRTKHIRKLESRLRIIGAAALLQQAMATGQIPATPVAPNVTAEYESGIPSWAPLAAAGLGLVFVGALALKRRSAPVRTNSRRRRRGRR